MVSSTVMVCWAMVMLPHSSVAEMARINWYLLGQVWLTISVT